MAFSALRRASSRSRAAQPRGGDALTTQDQQTRLVGREQDGTQRAEHVLRRPVRDGEDVGRLTCLLERLERLVDADQMADVPAP
ncbi:hypothetical protein ASE01_06395 [Nocardioides sp. Root190]|uniref:hypothetical protein n=1 Tax=Nocardioides sp. Root190 TaxID=1736488 RepID=UPI0006FAF9C7|nr:hypothetical protein [Nocardioides sp. Root190]KRB77819.1 hypothetical protein ASE01_06395 [Nocardioides sp. Root190]